MGVYGLSTNQEKLFELHIETHNLEQCLANARATPSPCTTPPLEHTTTSTTNTMSATTTTTSSLNPTTIGKIDVNFGGSQLNATDIENKAIKEHSLYGVVCILGIIVLVQFIVICLLAVKLCCGRKREKVMEEARVSAAELPIRRNSNSSQQNSNVAEETVIANTNSMDISTNCSIRKTNSCKF